jgi:predicted ATPase
VLNKKIHTYNFDVNAIRNIVKTPESLTLRKNGENLHYILENLKYNSEPNDDTFTNISSALIGIVDELEEIEVKKQPMGTEKVPEIFFKEKNDFTVSRDVISDGTLHLLAIITALYSNPILFLSVAIEEPERHLHMNAVSYLMDILRDYSRENQVIITTQSSEALRSINVDSDHLVFIYRDYDGFTRAVPARAIEEIKLLLKDYDYNIDDIVRNEILGYLGDYEQKR